MLPTVSRHSIARDDLAVRNTVSDGLSLMLMLNVPATVGLMALAEPIVQLLFQRGEFGPDATAATAAALQFYAIGLVGYSVTRIASPTFYALGLNRVPVIVSVAAVLVNALLNLLLVRWLGFRGLALGTSIAALFSGGSLLVLLHRRLHGLNDARLALSTLKIVAAAAIMGGVTIVSAGTLQALVPGQRLFPQIVRLVATIGASLVTLAAAAMVLRIREFRDGVTLVFQRVGRRP